MAIYRGPGGSGDATDDAANAAELIIQKTDEAAAYATSASNSATSAAASAVSAAASASGVGAFAAAAEAAAAAALLSETNAADSEVNAAISAANADEDAGTASTKANEAADSADDAAASASAAASSASSASTSASSASSSATSAASSASSASTSAGNAAISASNAASSATTAAGYVPSVTGNNGKYLRTNGTSNYWDIVDSFPSQTGNSGKFLKTNGTAVSWATVPSPDPATPLARGLVFGETDASTAIWSGTINNYNGGHPSGYAELVSCGTSAVIFVSSGSPLQVAISNGQVIAGQGISINDGTSTLNFGTVTSVTGSSPNFVLSTSISGWGAIGTDIRTVYQVILVGTVGGNVALGKSVLANLNNASNNTVLGYSAGASIVNGVNNIIIGYGADVSSDVSNEAVIGSSSIQTTRLYGALAVGGTSTGTSGQVLTSNGSGSAPSWSTAASGTVTSVALTAPTGLTVSGSPVTTSGTLALSLTTGYSIPTTASQTNWDSAYTDRLKWDGGATGLVASTGRTSLGLVIGTDIPSVSGSGATGTWGISITGNAANVTGTVAVANGGTGATTASGARTNLGLVIGTDVPSPTGTGASGTWGISVTGNAATVTNGLYSTGSYANPSWLTSLDGSKITNTINGGTY